MTPEEQMHYSALTCEMCKRRDEALEAADKEIERLRLEVQRLKDASKKKQAR